jgi:hypothetical protein
LEFSLHLPYIIENTMKKNIFLAIFALAFSTFAFGQLEIFVPGQADVLPTNVSVTNGDTIYEWGNSTLEMNINLYLVNTGVGSLTVNARRDSLNTPAAFDNCFCWGGLCFSNSTNVAPPGYTETLPRGDTANGANQFQGHYFPSSHIGKAYIRYDFYTEPISSDSAWVVVQYNATATGVQNTTDNINFLAPYPNPANNTVSFSYNLANGVSTANLKIFNLVGECIQTLPISSSKSKTTINVQSLPSGIYVCELQANGYQPTYQKLIVAH